MILFASDKRLETLFTSEWIFLDGTLESCPSQFSQFYTIHGLKFQQSQSINYVESLIIVRLDFSSLAIRT